LGNALSLNSAAHGAGRKMSRSKAKESTTMGGMKKLLQSEKVTLIGGSPEEAPLAYKDIETIMKCQRTLVESGRQISSEDCTDGKKIKL